jgi:hypothetical protein
MLTRRSLVKAGLAGVTALPALAHAEPGPTSRRPLRIAHLTDIHVQPELESARGLAACFAHVQSLPERGQAAGFTVGRRDRCTTGGHARDQHNPQKRPAAAAATGRSAGGTGLTSRESGRVFVAERSVHVVEFPRVVRTATGIVFRW